MSLFRLVAISMVIVSSSITFAREILTAVSSIKSSFPSWKNAFAMIVLTAIGLASGCSDPLQNLANTEASDLTDAVAYPKAGNKSDGLISAFYGLDDSIPTFATYRLCGSFGVGGDGMPVIFSEQVDIATLEAGDFQVTLEDGMKVGPDCVTPAPADDIGELRTILMIGDFGSIDNEPANVEVIGNLFSMDHTINYKGSQVGVTELAKGPSLVLAESVDKEEWELGKQASARRFGGGNGCPDATRQVIRVVWNGGVTKPGGGEVDDVERKAYKVMTVNPDGTDDIIHPFALGDLGDGDNNHELCLDTPNQVVRVEFPADLVTDPREDLNPATRVMVTSSK